jgi:hypothetical protein
MKSKIIEFDLFNHGEFTCIPHIFTIRANSKKQEKYYGYKWALVISWLMWDFQILKLSKWEK